MNGEAFARKTRRMTNPCNPLDCPAYASGYCEYDFATGMVMPMGDQCPLLREGASEVIGNDPEN